MPSLITPEEAHDLAGLTAPQDIEALVERAWRVRVERFRDSTDLCAACDGCTSVAERATAAEAVGAHRLCLSDPDVDALMAGVRLVAQDARLKRCASPGTLGRDDARRLRRAGAQRVHLTARDEPAIAAVRDAGLETCLAADLGRPVAERIDLAFELSAIEPTSVVMTLPDAGAHEAAKWVALFRLVLPGTLLRAAGALDPLVVRAGLNGAMLGPAPAAELSIFQTLGLNVGRQPDNGSRPRPDNRSGWLLGETPDIVGEFLSGAGAGAVRVRLWDVPDAAREVTARRLEAA